MKLVATAVTLLTILSCATAFPRFSRLNMVMTEDEKQVDSVVQGARGFFFGFQKGLYKVDKVDENCLNKEAE